MRLAVILLALAAGGGAAGAATLDVDDLGDDRPEAPYRTIGEALADSAAGDTIVIHPGIYPEQLRLPGHDLVIHSAAPGNFDVAARTIITTNRVGSVVVFSGTESERCTLEGLTIMRGGADNGGGIDGNGTNATIRDNIIEQNLAVLHGGGIYNCRGRIEGNEIRENEAEFGGGLAQVSGGVVSNSIEANSAVTGGGIYGFSRGVRRNVIRHNRALENGAGAAVGLEMENNLIELNEAGGGGGGVFDIGVRMAGNVFFANRAGAGGAFNGCAGRIEGNRFEKNRAEAGGGAGWGRSGTIAGNTFIGNRAGTEGGALGGFSGTVEGNRFEGNAADGRGGALASVSGTVSGNLVLANVAEEGGGLADCGGTIEANRLTGNAAATRGGAMEGCEGWIAHNVLQFNRAPEGCAFSGCGGEIQHNTIALNQGLGGATVVAGSARGAAFRYNIFYRNGGGQVRIAAAPGEVLTVFERNCFGGGDGIAVRTTHAGDFESFAAAEAVLEGWKWNIEADPRFERVPTAAEASGAGDERDYRLAADSPCIDAAGWHIFSRIPARGMDGLGRLEGPRPDLGAYERGAQADSDGDGLPDAHEGSMGTLALVADSDRDGLADGLETIRRTHPAVADTPGIVRVPGDWPSVQEGMLFALRGETVIVDPGRWLGALSVGRGMTLRGRQPLLESEVDATRIDAGGQGRVLTLRAANGEGILIEGVTLAGGRATEGALIDTGGTPIKLRHARVTANRAAGDGLVLAPSGEVSDCRFIDNSCGGGGIFSRFGGKVERSRFERNRAAWGVVAYLCGGIEFADCEFIENEASISGGVAFESDGSFTRGVARGNSARQLGGVLYRFTGPVTESDFEANEALRGGVLHQSQGLIARNRFAGNEATSGGVAYNCDGTIEENWFGGNVAVDGGVMFGCDGEIRNNRFEGNSGFIGGVLASCFARVVGNSFVGNIAADSGGVAALCGGELIENLFEGNEAGTAGGALVVYYGTIVGNRFIGNRSTANGGAIQGGEGPIEGNLFEANRSRDGGAIYNWEGSIRRNRFEGNVASHAGGAIGWGSLSTIAENLMTGNEAQYGGALQNCRFSKIAHNTIAGNRAAEGGGIHDCAGAAIMNNLLLENSAYGLWIDDDGVSPSLLVNNAFYRNGEGAYRHYRQVSVEAERIGDYLAQAEGNIGGDPKLENLRPMRGSVLIDAGATSGTLTAGPDLDGRDRPVDGDGDGRALPDIGAWEYLALPGEGSAGARQWLGYR